MNRLGGGELFLGHILTADELLEKYNAVTGRTFWKPPAGIWTFPFYPLRGGTDRDGGGLSGTSIKIYLNPFSERAPRWGADLRGSFLYRKEKHWQRKRYQGAPLSMAPPGPP
jgi:hypothetical protein